eukprot:GAHX01003134.1.p1 GENE.GAHX01003134.1~~GAHX01003134.1.p1  ORF type:complete len:64 (-),score=9.32 GAHX01003134.1:586-777(-)
MNMAYLTITTKVKLLQQQSSIRYTSHYILINVTILISQTPITNKETVLYKEVHHLHITSEHFT